MTEISVRFLPWDRRYPATPGDTLLEIAGEHDVPLPHACGGDAVCSTCAVVVLSDPSHLEPIEELEREALDKFFFNRSTNTRLSCQARISPDASGAIEIRSLEIE